MKSFISQIKYIYFCSYHCSNYFALWLVFWCSVVPGWTLSFSVGQLRRSDRSLSDVLLAELSQHGTVLLMALMLDLLLAWSGSVRHRIFLGHSQLDHLFWCLLKKVWHQAADEWGHTRVELLFRQNQTRTACCRNLGVWVQMAVWESMNCFRYK